MEVLSSVYVCRVRDTEVLSIVCVFRVRDTRSTINCLHAQGEEYWKYYQLSVCAGQVILEVLSIVGVCRVRDTEVPSIVCLCRVRNTGSTINCLRVQGEGYRKCTFHRIQANFMVQGGDFTKAL